MTGLSKRQLLVVLVFIFSCTEKTKINEGKDSILLKEIIATRIHDYKGEEYDSKIALSKNRLVIQSNVLYHSEYKIADSSIESVVNGFYKKDTSYFQKEVNTYKLKKYDIKQFIFFPKENIKYDKDGYLSTRILSNNGIIFFLNSRPVKGKINLELSKGNWKDTVSFQWNGNNQTFALYDITGDNNEELFIFEEQPSYWDGEEYLLKVFKLNMIDFYK